MKVFVCIVGLLLFCNLFSMNINKLSKKQREKLRVLSDDDDISIKSIFLNDKECFDYKSEDWIIVHLEDSINTHDDNQVNDASKKTKKGCCARFLQKIVSCLKCCKPGLAYYGESIHGYYGIE